MARLLLRNGVIFDGSGADPAPADIVVEEGRIIDVGPGLDGDEAVDLEGRGVLPGLFDCHVHVMFDRIDFNDVVQRPFSSQFYVAIESLQRTIETGITTVRDAGGADLGVKEAVEHGRIVGPRMQISLTMLSQTGGHGDGWAASGQSVKLMLPHPGRPSGLVDGPDAMRVKVREVVRAGADVIKVATSGGVLSHRDDPRHPHFDAAELEALVAEASAADRFVMAHAQSTAGIKNAVRAGIRSIEHGIYLDEEAIEMMIAAGTYLVPTLVAPEGVLRAAEAGASIPQTAIRKSEEVVGVHRRSFQMAVEAGVNIAFGTDAAVIPHGDNLREMELMADGGMTPRAIIEAATSSAARLMGVEESLGSLEPGKIADVVVVEGDPLDIGGLRDRIWGVWKDGSRVV